MNQTLFNRILDQYVSIEIIEEDEDDYVIVHPKSGKVVRSPKSMYSKGPELTIPPVFDPVIDPDATHTICQAVDIDKGKTRMVEVLTFFLPEINEPNSALIIEGGELWIVRNYEPYCRLDGKEMGDEPKRLFYAHSRAKGEP